MRISVIILIIVTRWQGRSPPSPPPFLTCHTHATCCQIFHEAFFAKSHTHTHTSQLHKLFVILQSSFGACEFFSFFFTFPPLLPTFHSLWPNFEAKSPPKWLSFAFSGISLVHTHATHLRGRARDCFAAAFTYPIAKKKWWKKLLGGNECELRVLFDKFAHTARQALERERAEKIKLSHMEKPKWLRPTVFMSKERQAKKK